MLAARARTSRLTTRLTTRFTTSPQSPSHRPALRLNLTTMASNPTVKTYAALVLGSGQSGTPLATALANAGHKTALIESAHVGGTCINEGCTPTKTMVASARVAYLARRAGDYGVQTGGSVSVDMTAVRKRKRDIVSSFRGGSERRLKGTENLDLVMGKARFVGVKEVEVELNDGGGKQRMKAEKVFVNVGGRPAPLKVPGAEEVDVLDSTSVMELGVVPEHLMVVGGGYVGLEFAQVMLRLGAKVTVVQRGAQLLGREDDDIAEAVKKILEEDGMEIKLNTALKGLSKTNDGKISVVVTPKGGEETKLTASHILNAAGRIPNTDSLDAETSDIKLDSKGYVVTNDKLETNMSGIYALGDVKGGPAFTHISYDDFRVLQTNVLNGKGSGSIKDRLVPYTVYIDPQLGRIGLTETEARKQNLNIKVAKMPMAWVARALETDESRGMMKAIVDADTDQILGAAVLGIEGGEIMSMLQIAMMGKLPYTALQNAVLAHPTLAESLNNLWGNWVD